MLRNWKMFLHTLILLSSKCLAQQNRQRGTCVTLERGVDVQILAQEHWRNGGELTANLKFDRYEHRLVRRAGIINDFSFFEIQLEATTSKGTIKLYPGKPSTPVTRIVTLGNNMFHLDLDNSKSAILSRAGQMTTTLRLRHSRSGTLNYDNVKYRIVTAQLCDGGYNDVINKNGLPGLPHGCSAAANPQSQSIVMDIPGVATFSTFISTNRTKIGCKGVAFLGFDAPLEVKSFPWPIIGTQKVSKQLKECKSNQNDGCEGHFYKVEFDTEPSEFSHSDRYEVKFEMTFVGSESHVPVSTFQYNCNMNWYCEGDLVPTVPVKIVHVPKQEGWVNTQAPQTGHTVVQPEQATQPYIPPKTTEPTKLSTRPKMTTSKTIGTESSATTEIVESTKPQKIYHDDSLSFNEFDFAQWTQENMHFLLSKINPNSQRPFGLSLIEYGCTCGSFNINEETHGMPLDETDRACKRWRQCHRCVQESHGNCDSPYQMNRAICGDQLGSCQRRACECDRVFLLELESARYDASYAHDSMTDTEEQCHKSASAKGGAGECCLHQERFSWFNASTHQCCPVSGVAPIGMC